ncbi:MAG: class I fructose-bisphosphate aldolase [Promethearchaeota archaeon]|nr:MAG: class I fructose-bisphosphate aldolase [Candidatus Lokiarchaeota archaeon]
MTLSINEIRNILGDEADDFLTHTCQGISKDNLYRPGPDFIERVVEQSDRNNRVLLNMQRLFQTGRLANTGYLSILPVDHGIEHAAGADFAPNPIYFDPEKIIELAIKGGCSGVASTLGVLGSLSRRYSRKIPFILKINHNELLSKPNFYDQTLFASVDQAYKMGAVAVGATIYFGSLESRRQIMEISEAFEYAHDLGLVTVLWAYLRNPDEFIEDGVDYHDSNDMCAQADHLGATIGADIIKQKISKKTYGFQKLNFGKTSPLIYDKLAPTEGLSEPQKLLEWNRFQVANCYMGRVGLINSGGPSGENDLQAGVKAAIINKRAGGWGLIMGRKAFQRPMDEGIKIINAVQDVYLSDDIDLA